MSKVYGQIERKVINAFARDEQFVHDNRKWRVIEVDKPRPQNGRGECKTDVFVGAESEYGELNAFRLSIKEKSSNEFQENKISAQRAEDLFGNEYEEIIEFAARSIEKTFYELPLVFASKKGRVQANSITMGWKLEIASKPRSLCVRLPMDDQQMRDYVYKGTNLPLEKRNAKVKGRIIPGSGEAEYIVYLDIDNFHSAQDVINAMKSIDLVKFPDMYLIFTGNNFRTEVDSTDGKRPLAVRVQYFIHNGKLSRKILFDRACHFTGHDVKLATLSVLKQLGKNHPSEFTPRDFVDPKIFIW